MKLYATVESERASKGQGGNERLDTVYTTGDNYSPFLAVNMTVREDDTVLVQIVDYRADRIALERVIPLREYQSTKGKKQ
jgi:hypothetical protein